MRIGRRLFLQQISLGAVCQVTHVPAVLAQTGQASCSVLLDGVDPGVSGDLLGATIQAFLDQALPVGVILRLEDGAPVLPDGLAAHVRAQPNMIELVPWCDGLALQRPYFQMRKVTDLAETVRQAIGAAPLGLPWHSWPVSLASQAPEKSGRLNGLRVAGFRNLVLTEDETAPTDLGCAGPASCTTGGVRLGLADPDAVLSEKLNAARRRDSHIQIVLDLAAPAGADAAAAGAKAAAIAELTGRGVLTPILPRELITRSGLVSPRLLALRLDHPSGEDPNALAAFEEFQAGLQQLEIGFSVVRSVTDPALAESGAVPLLADAPADAGELRSLLEASALPEVAVLDQPRAASEALVEAGVRVAVSAKGGGLEGIDRQGLHHLSPQLVLDGSSDSVDLQEAFGPYRDAMVAVAPAAYATQARRNTVLNALRRVAELPSNRIVDLGQYATARQAADPVFGVMLAAKARGHAILPDPVPLSPEDRAALIEDAKTAWRYFDLMTYETSGLLPSTALRTASHVSINNTLTMWDMGSLIFAVVSAARLGLITEEEARQRAAAIVEGLSAASLRKPSLPPGQILARRPATASRDFSACDTGRLLSALWALRQSPADPGGIEELVNGWELESKIQDGILHSVVRGRDVESFDTHCAHYAARAFGRWGLQAKSPYAAMTGPTPTDAQMNLLYAVAHIGAIGAEPLLLEGVEFGLSAPSAYLADMLFGAQLAMHEETGQMYCASEGPLPEYPWFSYQGYSVINPETPWKVSTLPSDASLKTEDFRQRHLMTSSKAAYLWAAMRPHAYSRELLHYVRSRARTANAGFSVGIFLHGEKVTENYSDVNTNGVILQAIAHMLDEAPAH